jgi:hypothetical protein
MASAPEEEFDCSNLFESKTLSEVMHNAIHKYAGYFWRGFFQQDNNIYITSSRFDFTFFSSRKFSFC